MAQKPTIAPLLGMERVDYERPPLITEATVLWRIVCLGPEAEAPQAVADHRGEERCAQALASSERSAWPCSACGRPGRDHVRIWTEGVPLDEAFRAHRAMQLGQEAPQAPEPPPVNPESLPPRSKSGELEHRAPLPPSEATPRKRGPHAERLAKARAAQEAATRPKPAPEGVNRGPKVVKPKDPFDVEEDG